MDIYETIESPDLHGDCLVTLAEVLAPGAPDDARAALQQALELYMLKGNLVSAERTRMRIGETVAVAEGTA